MQIRPKIGLALGGGGARGLVHVGFLKVLEEASIPIDCISGASMGGVIAAAYACGIPIAEIEERALLLSNNRELVKFLDIAPPRYGLIEGDMVRDFLADWFIDRNFEDLAVRLALPAVDLIQAKEVVFTKGLVLPAVLATLALPGIIRPVEINSYRLVDGGVLNNLPVDRVRELGADRVIALDPQYNPYKEMPWQSHGTKPNFPLPLPDFILDFYRAELIMIAEITQAHLLSNPPDLLLDPQLPQDIDVFLGFPRISEVIKLGERCARNALPAIERLIEAGLSPN
jgi:NTE family protein